MSGEWVTDVDDYVTGEMSDFDAARFEARLFDAAAAGTLGPYEALRAGLRELDARGTLMPFTSRAEAERIRALEGVRVRYLDVGATPVRAGEVSPDETDVVVIRYPLDLRGVRRLEVEFTSGSSSAVRTNPDVFFEPGATEVFACCEAVMFDWATGSGGAARFISVENGERRVLAEFEILAPPPV